MAYSRQKKNLRPKFNCKQEHGEVFGPQRSNICSCPWNSLSIRRFMNTILCLTCFNLLKFKKLD